MPRFPVFPEFTSTTFKEFLHAVLYWIRVHVYYIMLGIVVLALFITNFSTGTVVSGDKTVFAFLQKSNLITPFPVFTFLSPLFGLFIGGLGMIVFLEHIRMHEKKRLMAFVGAVAYILNPFTLAIVSEPYSPSFWFFAILPWALWSFFMVLCDNKQPSGKKLFIFSLANIAIAPAFVDPIYFIAYLLIIIISSIGLIFSIYFFKAVWQSPWIILLAILLQIPWFGPLLYRIFQSPDISFFEPLRSYPLPASIEPLLIPILVLAAFGVFMLQRYYIVFLFLLGFLLLEWLPLPEFVLQFIKPYSYYFFIPIAFILGYYVAAGVSILSLGIHFLVSFIQKKRTPHHKSLWQDMKGKSPFDLYQEINHITKYENNTNAYTPVPFTEHFVNHILHQAHHHIQKEHKQKTMIPRIVGYIAFTILVLTSIYAFRGGLFSPDYLVSISPPITEVMQRLRNTNAIHVAYIPSDQPSAYEVKTAIERESDRILQTVMEKYVLSHIVIDSTHLLPQQLQFLARQPYLQMEKQADTIFLFSLKNPPNSEVRFLQGEQLPNVGPRASIIQDDLAYRNHGLYHTDDSAPYMAYYPFIGMQEKQFKVDSKNTRLEAELNEELMRSLDQYELESGTESADITMVGDAGQTITIPATMYPELIANRMTLNMNTQRVRYFNPKKAADSTVHLETQALEQRYGYLVQVSKEKEPNRVFQVEVFDKSRVYEYVDTTVTSSKPFILAPGYERGIGYVFAVTPERFDNITVFYLPYSDILGTRFIKREDLTKRASLIENPKTNKLASGMYEVSLSPTRPDKTSTVIFLEPYSNGWKMYEKDPAKVSNALETMLAKWLPFIYGKEYGKHVAVNNWANGWVIDKPVLDNNVVIVDVPRYIGYGCWILAGVLITIFGLIWFASWYKSLE